MDENRKKALAAALTQIEKQFGKGSVMRMGDVGAVRNIEAISTGSLGLDLALGIGGVPKGRVIEIYGPESSGKTTLTLHIIAESQKLGGTAAFVDAEHALDPVYAEKLGVNMTDLLVSQPDTGEQALEITDMLVRSGAVDIVVVDSVAALTPKAEIEGEMGDSHVGLQARLMSQALRKLTGNIKRSNCCVIFINQIRMKIGVMFGCFDYHARVVLADGTTRAIGEIVEQRLPVEVLSMNPSTGKLSPCQVVNWFRNGETDEWLDLDIASPDGITTHRLTCTSNHLIFTPNGTCPAGELVAGDEVMAAFEGNMHSARLVQIASRPAAPDQRERFDLEVAGNHSYLVDHVAVHNSPETTTGGNALKFYASVRLDIRRTGGIKKGDEVIGNETKVKVVKNKVAPPFRQAEFDILYGQGISREGEIVDLGVAEGFIDKSGAWYSYEGTRIGQGKDNARNFLCENRELARTIEARIRDKLLPKDGVEAPAETDALESPED
ncbi:protein RecA [Allochromatium warmingii]|uniref:Protein RecA n=1 Tax=Allochromatium warmingii TaxID=61595 RepID=A0A1H3FJT1_ALLWA|nr:protein RecA [Allochromatium warmingii]